MSSENKMNQDHILTELADILELRKREASSQNSYVAQLIQKGQDAILKKIIEESGEVLMAAKDGDKDHLVKEIADLWFHNMVLLTYHSLRPEEVLKELASRFDVSGLVEKASRIEK